jgi:hypothetical protein
MYSVQTDWKSDKGNGVIRFTDRDYPGILETNLKQDNPVLVFDS